MTIKMAAAAVKVHSGLKRPDPLFNIYGHRLLMKITLSLYQAHLQLSVFLNILIL